MDYEVTEQELVNYYVNLLIIQYHNQPKAKATIAALINSLISGAIALQVLNGYDVYTAIGHQLDILGKYADINRFYSGQDLEGYFGFSTYSDSAPIGTLGFSDYATYTPPAGQWLLYSGILSSTLALDDADFRTLLLLRIIQNNINFSRQAIDQAIFDTFGLTVIPDSIGNMVMDYIVENALSAIIQVAIQQMVLPKPMGVRLRYIIAHSGPIFGFATYENIPVFDAGFSNYSNYNTIPGETLTYSDLIAG